MAKRQQVGVALGTWDEVDAKLGELCQIEVRRRKLEAKMNGELAAVRARYEGETGEITDAQKAAGALVEQFCLVHRAEFGAKKSKELLHGIVSFRTSPPAVALFNRKWTWASVIEALKRGASRFVRSKEEPDKEAILAAHAAGEVDDGDLAGVGVKVEQKETFGVELRYEEAGEAAAPGRMAG